MMMDDASCQPPNKQLQRSVIPNRWRWTTHRAAAELRRSATQEERS
jgi:hypothetical protein